MGASVVMFILNDLLQNTSVPPGASAVQRLQRLRRLLTCTCDADWAYPQDGLHELLPQAVRSQQPTDSHVRSVIQLRRRFKDSHHYGCLIL